MYTKEKQSVIIIPGLGKSQYQFAPILSWWKRFYNITPIVYGINWYDDESFEDKARRISALVRGFKEKNAKVYLIGTSAGGSTAFNAFAENRTLIYKAVNVCGRLRRGKESGFRSFETRTNSSKSFRQSVVRFEDVNQDKLSRDERKRLMTVRALFGDELVPWETTVLAGAKNIFVPTVEHIVSIVMALTVFSKPIVEFLKT